MTETALSGNEPNLAAIIPNWTTTDERLDRELLARAYRYSERAHLGQKRFRTPRCFI